MLILRRKAGETLVIGDDIKVAVLDINEGSVRLAIDAPKQIPILRSELLQAADVNRDAARGESRPQELLHLLNNRGGTSGAVPMKPKRISRGGGAARGGASALKTSRSGNCLPRFGCCFSFVAASFRAGTAVSLSRPASGG